jgi:hypothetical protein
MFGLLRQWQALESRAAAAKLGVLRALIRDDDQPLAGGGNHGDLPEGWTKSLTHDVALALAMPAVSAERLMWLAWDLEGRLPGIGGLLAAGTLTTSKAQAVDEALAQLSVGDAAAAEAMILADLPGKTYGQAVKLAVQAAVTVNPESATRRRQDAERNRSRVEMFREQSGAAALAGRELPTDQALAAQASVCARALAYQESGAFPDGTRMDQYRAAAYLDLLNGVTAAARVVIGVLPGACPDGEPSAEKPTAQEPAAGGSGCPCRECDDSCLPPDDEGENGGDPDGGDPDGGAPGSEGPRGDPGQGNPDGRDRAAATRPAAKGRLTVPALTAVTAVGHAATLTLRQNTAQPSPQPLALVPHGSRTWCSRWPRSSDWATVPVRATDSARSTLTCAANSASRRRPALAADCA